MTQYDKNAFEQLVAEDTSSRRWLWEQWPDSLEGKRVLDLGCGTGLDIGEILSRGGAAWGIDNSEQMIDATRATLANRTGWTVERRGMEKLAGVIFWPEKFDLVTARHSIHHLLNLNRIRELYTTVAQMLDGDGQFTFVVVHPMHYQRGYGMGNCTFSIYGGAEVTVPAHTLSDYLNHEFLRLFTITGVKEWFAEEAENFDGKPVWWLGISAHKR